MSQLLGSTLALEYMRAGTFPASSRSRTHQSSEYVAPLGSSSLIFNFLFARFLVGTPVTSTDIYVRVSHILCFPICLNLFQGTIIVILGVIGIVAFGSINSGLSSQTD
ncbi:hypothetical protein C0993_006168, partial [Termitomyces sp. T159_Od127]